MKKHFRSRLRIFAVVICLSSTATKAAEIAEPTKGATKLVSQSFELLESGETELALEGFNKVLQEDASDLSARLGQAMIFSDQQRHEDAFASYDLIIQSYPDHAFAWNGRGLAAFNLENFDEALSSFKQATADQPMNGFFYESLAWTHLCRGDYTEAAASAKRATLIYNQNEEITSYPLLIAYFANLDAGDQGEAQLTLKYAQNNKPANNAWPAPIFDYLAGRLSAPQLISFVQDTAQETEAHTYIGLHLRSKDKAEEAQQHLNWVAVKGDARVFEHMLARRLQAPKKVAQLAP